MKLAPETSPLLRLLLFSFLPLLIGALILVSLAPGLALNLAHCPLRDITGFPCPTCGGTQTATHVVQGHWWSALQANPMVLLLGVAYVLAAVYAGLATLIPSWRRSLQLTAHEKRTARLLAVLLLFLNWAWLVYRYLF